MDTLPPVRNHADAALLREGSDGAAFGQFLRRARERRGLTLQQISHETKIPERHLHALEHGNLSEVPRGIYQRAEIRAFAKTVGLDQNLALAQFERALEPLSEAGVPATQPVDEETRPRALAVIGIMSLAIAAISVLTMWTQRPAPQLSAQPVLAAGFATYEAMNTFPRAPKPLHAKLTATSVRAGSVPITSVPNPSVPATEVPATSVPAIGALGEITQAPLAPRQVDGQLVITTVPDGARVTVNGVGWGITPLTIRHLPFGDNQIRVTKEGYASEQRRVALAEDRPARKLHIDLRVQQ